MLVRFKTRLGYQCWLRPSSVMGSLSSVVWGVFQLPPYLTVSVTWVVTSEGCLPRDRIGQTLLNYSSSAIFASVDTV